jgi:hypothetical protein
MVSALGTVINNIRTNVNAKRQSGGKAGGLLGYLGSAAVTSASAYGVQKAGLATIGPQVKGVLGAKKVVRAGVRKAVRATEGIADNRRFKRAKLVRPGVSGLLYK